MQQHGCNLRLSYQVKLLRERQTPYDITYMWNLKIQHKWTCLQNRNWLRDPENRTVVSKGEREGRGMDWEFGVGKCKLLHLEWINKVRQYRTGNYIQNHVINHKKSSHSVMSDFLWPHRLYSPWNSLGQNTGVGSLSLLQGIFPIQVSRNCRQILYQLCHKGTLRILEWGTYSFSSGSSQPRNQTGVSCIAGGFFTSWATREASW